MATEPAPPAAPARRRGRVRRVVLGRPTTGGSILALVFWWRSLTPTLMPRSWVAQAAISAICTLLGYALGTVGARLVHLVLRRLDRTPGPELRGRVRQGLAVLAVGTVAVGLPLWLRWQDEQRELVTLDALAPVVVLPMVLLTVVLMAVIAPVGRLVGAAVRKLDRWNRRHLPTALARPLTIALVLALAVLLTRDLAFARFTSWAGTTFGLADSGTAEGTERPTAATVSGGPGSLVAWDDLGFQGREFVAGATTVDDLRAFHGPDAEVEEPIRAYAGLRSADNVRERARLAVAELERTGAFDRDVLVVATATGSGWIDPDAAEAIEQLHAGDTAIVSMQYSYLPSWIAFITDLELASDAGAVLFDEVSAAWRERPADERPRLVAFGLSLGSFGAEAAFAGRDAATSLANMTARTDGVLLVGAAHSNPILRQLTAARDAGSPAWAPVVDAGEVVRFRTRDPDHAEPDGPWPEPRVLYVQHPSDPVTYWSASWLWAKPEWMDDPRGYDVPDRGGWFPVVTFVQGVFDLMAGFGAPPGYGHDYRLDYVDAWADVAPPPGWTGADTARLEDHLFGHP